MKTSSDPYVIDPSALGYLPVPLGGVQSMFECQTCFALVRRAAVYEHLEWHDA